MIDNLLSTGLAGFLRLLAARIDHGDALARDYADLRRGVLDLNDRADDLSPVDLCLAIEKLAGEIPGETRRRVE